LVKAGALRGISIGFSANEVVMKGTKAFDDICKKIGLSNENYDKVRRIIKSWTLYEFSICSVPCNPNCTTKSEEVKVEEKVETKEEIIKSLEKIAEILETPAEVIPEAKEEVKKVEEVIIEVKEEVIDSAAKMELEHAAEVTKAIEVPKVEVKEEPKAEPIEIIPHVKRYIQVIQTPEEQKEYIDMCIKARLRGKTRISIV